MRKGFPASNGLPKALYTGVQTPGKRDVSGARSVRSDPVGRGRCPLHPGQDAARPAPAQLHAVSQAFGLWHPFGHQAIRHRAQACWCSEVLGDCCLFLRFTALAAKKMWWLVVVIILPRFLFEEMSWDWPSIAYNIALIPLSYAFAVLVVSGLILAFHGIKSRISEPYRQQFDGKDKDATLRILERIYFFED
jgi:hypothetical protein